MNHYRSIFICLFCCLIAVGLQGQSDTIYQIPSVEIKAFKIRVQPSGNRSEHWDSTDVSDYNLNNLADLLQRESGIFIKSYGLGSIATSSIRGASAGHTTVLWNGIPLQSPMLGLLDLSLVPGNFVDDLSIQYGGGSALWGSGAIGGVIALNNQTNFDNKLSLQSQTAIGSFGDFQRQLNFNIGNQKFQSSTRLFHHQADNDFEYQINASLPVKKQTNAQFSQQALLQELHFKFHPKHHIAAYFWQQFSNRQIPPVTTQNRSLAKQKDNFTRLILDWKYLGKKHLLQSKVAYFNEYIDFEDPLILLRSLTRFTTWSGEITGEWHWHPMHKISFGISEFHTKAYADAYAQPPTEFRTALFAAYQFHFQKWTTQLSLRQTWVDKKSVPFVPVLGIDGELTSFLFVHGKVSRNYRLPTFNDRFWRPGGNPNLKAESGWSQELGLSTEHQTKHLQINYSITGFNRNIDNWILWGIKEGENFYSANNLTKVWSRGIEQRLSLQTIGLPLQIKLSGGYDFIRSTNELALSNPNIEKGSQLVYVPKHQAFAKIDFQYKNWRAVYRHQFTGTVMGLSDDLDEYQVGYARLQYALTFSKYKINTFIKSENLWNTTYRIVERRPMPGRHFQLGFQFVFNQ